MLVLKISGREVDVVSGAVTLPRCGAWHADLVVSADAPPSGNLVAALSEVDMPAHVQRAELVGGMVHLRIVGGNGGLAKLARAKHYRNPLVRHVLGDLLADAGEAMSSNCTPAVATTALPYWTSLGLPTGELVQALADIAGADVVWRVQFNGVVWMGLETWPACPADVRILDRDACNASQVVGTDACGIWPGTTIQGRRVDMVVHSIGASPRSEVYFAEGHQ